MADEEDSYEKIGIAPEVVVTVVAQKCSELRQDQANSKKHPSELFRQASAEVTRRAEPLSRLMQESPLMIRHRLSFLADPIPFFRPEDVQAICAYHTQKSMKQQAFGLPFNHPLVDASTGKDMRAIFVGRVQQFVLYKKILEFELNTRLTQLNNNFFMNTALKEEIERHKTGRVTGRQLEIERGKQFERACESILGEFTKKAGLQAEPEDRRADLKFVKDAAETHELARRFFRGRFSADGAIISRVRQLPSDLTGVSAMGRRLQILDLIYADTDPGGRPFHQESGRNRLDRRTLQARMELHYKRMQERRWT